MIDSIGIHTKISLDEVESFIYHLQEVKRSPRKIIGKINGIPIKVLQSGDIYSNFSLPKYFLRLTGKVLNVTLMQECIENILDDIPAFHDGNLYRIDIADTFTMSQPIPNYLEVLGPKNNCRRVEDIFGSKPYRYDYDHQTKHYRYKIRSLVFYDKNAEELSQRKGMKPEKFIHNLSTNELRYELQFKEGVAKQLYSDIEYQFTLMDLLHPSLLKLLADYWKNEFDDILLIPQSCFCPVFDTTIGFQNALASYGYQCAGPNNVEALIKKATKERKISSQSGSRLRRKLRKNYRQYSKGIQSDPISELQNAVNTSYKKFLTHIESLQTIQAVQQNELNNLIEGDNDEK